MAELFVPDAATLSAGGYSSVSHVPVIFELVPGPKPLIRLCREYGRFLRERALAEWTPGAQDTASAMKRRGIGGKIRYLTPRSLVAIAERLANFSQWLATTDGDWRCVEYTADIVRGYQAQMVSGRWSHTGKRLAVATVNARVATACQFLTWAGDRGYRAPFTMITSRVNSGVQSGTSSHGERGLVISSRAGALQPPPRALAIPSIEAVSAWLAAVRIRRGATKDLMCRFALGTAARREEVVQFRLGDFPYYDPAIGPTDPRAPAEPWHDVNGQVMITLRHGTKGQKSDPVGAPDIGPQRTVRVPIELARDLLAYRNGRRLRAALLFKRREGRLPDRPADLFFLSEHDGRPVSADTFYRLFKVPPRPMSSWHPHNVRDYWACTTMINALEAEAKSYAALKTMPLSWVSEMGRSIVQMVIRPQLGHLSEETTMTYLKWLSAHYVLAPVYTSYHQHLEADNG